MKNFDGNNSVEVHFIGDTLDTGRNIKEHSLYSSGDVIKLTGKNRNTNYMVDITQTIFVEEDPNNNCRNYPNQDYHSYQECDEKYMRNLLPADLMPMWLSDNFSEVSTQVFDENGTSYDALLDLFDGSNLSDCPLPCKTTQTRNKFLFESLGEDARIEITFSSTVRVSKTDLEWPTITSFLSEVKLKFENFQKKILFRWEGRWASGLALGQFNCSSC